MSKASARPPKRVKDRANSSKSYPNIIEEPIRTVPEPRSKTSKGKQSRKAGRKKRSS